MGPNASGLRIDDTFEIVKNLGRDGVGSVYLARYKGDCLVAVKLLAARGTSSEERFARECRVLMSLRHPSIVSAYTSGRVAGVRYLVMEYVDGVNAADHRRANGGPLTFAQCAELLLPIADALAYCHTRGIFHGDVSPRNILVQHVGPGQPPSARLVDFGGSWATDDDEEVTGGIVLPNMDFQPLERFDAANVDPAALGETSDIYALAATAYFLTAGRGAAGKLLTSDERSGASALEATQDEAWNAMLLWALQPDRAQRLPSMSLFRSLLRAWLPEASDRHDGSRFEPFWAQDAEPPSLPTTVHDTAPTEPLDAEFVALNNEIRKEGWWFDMMLESLPEHERRTEGAPQTVRVDPTPTRWMPMLGLGVLIAFVAGVTVADLLETAPPAPPDTPAVEEGR